MKVCENWLANQCEDPPRPVKTETYSGLLFLYHIRKELRSSPNLAIESHITLRRIGYLRFYSRDRISVLSVVQCSRRVKTVCIKGLFLAF